MGAPHKVRNPLLLDVRMWRVEGFEQYLIFYFPRPDGIAKERVITRLGTYYRILGSDRT